MITRMEVLVSHTYRIFSTPPPPPGGGHYGAPPGAQARAPPPPRPAVPQPPSMFQPPPPVQQRAAPPPPPGMMQPPPPAAPAPQHGAGPTSQFYQPAPAPPQMQHVGGAGVAPAAPGAPAAMQEQVDFSIKIPDRLCRFSVGKIPQSPSLGASTKVPIGGIIRPLAPDAEDDEAVATVQPGNAGIIRCKRYVPPIAAGWLYMEMLAHVPLQMSNIHQCICKLGGEWTPLALQHLWSAQRVSIVVLLSFGRHGPP